MADHRAVLSNVTDRLVASGGSTWSTHCVDIEPHDFARAREDCPRLLRVELAVGELDDRSVTAGDLGSDCSSPRSCLQKRGNSGNGERQAARRHLERASSAHAGHGRRRGQVCRIDEWWHEAQAPMLKPHTQFDAACDQVFFDLARHAGLLNAREGRRVRIGVGGETSVSGGRRVHPQTGADVGVVSGEALQHDCVRPSRACGVPGLEHCQPQLGHHVPIHTAETFVAEEGARASVNER